MARFRKIETDFWNDAFIEERTPEDRYFFMFLLTNPYTRQCGIYEITHKKIADLLGYDRSVIKSLIDRFEGYGKIKYNDETKEMCVINWGRYNLTRGGKPILDCIKAELKTVKDKSLIEIVLQGIENEQIRSVFYSFLESDNVSSTLRDTYRGQEEEEEEEEEEKEEEEVSTPTTFESPKKETKKRQPKGKTLFKTNFGGEDGFEKFCAAFEGSDYVEMGANLRYYFEAVRDWSASSGAMKADWIATARNFMRGDIKNNKFVKNGALTTTNQKPTVDVDLAKRATDRFLAKRGINLG